MKQHWFINCNKHSMLIQDVINKGKWSVGDMRTLLATQFL